ncbi:lipase [Melampsora larici-populina 98AG31]|uniref:Lipase n=1 Tax=Melampsora larici-populina (strain 98AG31 / pathotype 3-4-7) TaxID=747676 RepID=F4S1J0_MELLP|nr:lipase [Melampsora larici-populina 98AG31]EGG01384.1 lipase [Melampsora larici-populina 98AG31]
MASRSLRSSVALALLVLALVSTFGSLSAASNLPEDAPFTVPKENMESSLKCIDAHEPMDKPGGVILLVHGTLSTPDVWFNYIKLLPTLRPGYDICHVNLPDFSLGDVQVTSEYVAFAIDSFAQKSATQKVKIISHSQGGLNTQWALTFWPSLRSKVDTFIALAADFKGAKSAETACEEACPIAYAQQKPNSNLIQALDSNQDCESGASALVSTFSIYSESDNIVTPEFPPNEAASYLSGAKMIPIQSFCGEAYNLTHIPIVFDSSIYQIVQDVLEFKSFLPSRAKLPCQLQPPVPMDPNMMPKSPSLLRKSNLEPGLNAYVCSRGYATQCNP